MLRKLVIILCLVTTVLVAYGQKKKRKSPKEKETSTITSGYKEVGAPMPPIRLITKQREVITDKDFKNKASLLVMMFNPTCSHCIEMTHILKKNEEVFEETGLVLLAAPGMLDNLQYFEDLTHYPKHPILNVGVDSSGFIDKTFLYESLPQINIYNKDRKLIKIFNGETPIDSLKPYVE